MTLPAFGLNQPTFAENYEQFLVGPLFSPWAEITLDEVNLRPGDRVLDIACGTGVVARLAKKRLDENGQVVGIDVSPDMLAVARPLGQGIDWREGNAGALPLRDGEQFDVVVCQQGLQFMPDKAAAAAQMRRALAPGGRLAVETWRPESECPFSRDLRLVAERHVGDIVDPRCSFGEERELRALLHAAGLQDVRCRTVTLTIHFDDATAFPRLNAIALVGMSAQGRTLAPAERRQVAERIFADSADVIASYMDGSALAFELSSNLATARA